MKKLLVVMLILNLSVSRAQEYFPKNDRVNTPENEYVAFTGSSIFVSPGVIPGAAEHHESQSR